MGVGVAVDSGGIGVSVNGAVAVKVGGGAVRVGGTAVPVGKTGCAVGLFTGGGVTPPGSETQANKDSAINRNAKTVQRLECCIKGVYFRNARMKASKYKTAVTGQGPLNVSTIVPASKQKPANSVERTSL